LESKKRIFAAAIYPFTLATIATGFLALILILAEFKPLEVTTIVSWFYFISMVMIYSITRRILKLINLHRVFQGFILVFGVLAILSSILLLQ
jgi:hypothetical protein